MKRLISILTAVCSLVVAVMFFAPTLPASAQSSAALSIVPKKNYIIEPGKSVDDTLLIRNLDNTIPLKLTLRIVDFTYTDDGGTPKLMLDPDAPQTTWSLKPFMSVPEFIEIPPNESKSLDMSVKIPAGHGAGSYYSAIVYSSGAPTGGNVGLSASGVTLVFTNIPGDVNEDLKLEKLGAYRDAVPGKPADFVYMTGTEPQKVAYKLKNGGNVTEAPVGNITLTSMFGKKYVINDVNPTRSLALIGQSRTYTACIKLEKQEVKVGSEKSKANTCVSPGLWPGYYTMDLDLFYGQNGNQTKEVVGNSSFWYLPAWFVFLFLVLLLVLAYLVWRAVRWVREKLYGKKRTKVSHRKR